MRTFFTRLAVLALVLMFVLSACGGQPLAIGGPDFSKLQMVLKESADPTQVVAIRYGMFLQATIDFIIIALVIFVMVKLINGVRREQEAVAPPAPPHPKPVLLTEIRDLLREPRR